MSSPFSNFEEFSSAEGPIYTFANNPTMITILLIISLIISIYFFYASFSMKQETDKSMDAKALGLLLVAGLTTIAGTLFNPNMQKHSEGTHARSSRMEQSTRSFEPLAILGMMGLGGASLRRTRRPSRRTRSMKRSRLTR